jgi:DMSO/TMAO reductase YedYZ molybdopterin-dependent catalytic subunit
MAKKLPTEVTSGDARRMTRRAFGVAGLLAFAGAGGWWWLRTRSDDEDIPWPLRTMHRFNEMLGRALFSAHHRTREYRSDQATDEPRVNGSIGRPAEVPTTWSVRVEDGDKMRSFGLVELLGDLPRVEMTTEFMCIEGWSQIVTWGGVRFRDAAAKHGWPTARAYVGLETPDRGYMVGLDMPSALHPQTLLCDTMNGEPLPEAHGGPLRLVIPVKYGIKNLKWLARVRFSDERPADYWARRGYDWYSGL